MKAYCIFGLFVFISFISFSEGKENKNDFASNEEKNEMKKVFFSFLEELESLKGDFSITVDILKKGRVKEKRVEKIWTSGDSVSYSMEIGIADQTEVRSIICNRTPKFWLGYRIEKSTGYAKERYQEGYINNLIELDSLLIPIRRELTLVKEYKEKNKK